ncbi:hypothetical protein [Marinicella meishanensis]|uniref:hypothetical protein n=1 Tax=Marinicella meishanensis TaxID=2873263 RepID=UPI001CBDE287|nr:hypothetical protein [Marinicella sp. NBU2979]
MAEITLEMDRDLVIGQQQVVPIFPLAGNTQYQVGAREVNVRTTHAVICNRIDNYQPVSNVHVRVLDPNGENKGDHGGTSVMGVQSNVNYSLNRRALVLRSENRSKSICLSAEEFDVIFATPFADEPVQTNTDITYEFTNEPPGGYTAGDIMSYELTFTNNTGSEQMLDFVEYYPYNNSLPAYFNKGGNISCSLLDSNNDPIQGSFCLSANGVVKDVVLQPTEKVRLTIARQISSNAAVGANLQMMAAAFPKVSTIDSVGSSYSFAGFDMDYRLVEVVKQ